MLEIDDITIAYDSGAVQQNFSLAVSKGRKVCLSGPSGSGKSSILQSILGFVIPQHGTIRIAGTQLTEKTVWSLRRKIGYVAQEPDLGDGTVEEIIQRPFSFRANQALSKNLDQLPALLKRFSLDESIVSKNISSLSGGEKQRIGLIITLLLDRPLLLLDEISSALDPKCKQAVADYLSQTQQTVLMVSHDSVMQSVCDKTISLPDPTKGSPS
jgi:putative ABC transport system ATP-binding protein